MEIISPPLDMELVGWEPLSGPRSIKAGQNEAIGGYVQGFSSPFGTFRIRLLYAPQEGQEARQFRGWVADLMGGANITRLPFLDPDRMTFEECGMFNVAPQTWSNGQPWSNGLSWGPSRPPVRVAATASRQGTVIELEEEFWGHRLGWGSFVGFFPFYFGMHQVRRVIAPGRYLLWPWLHKDIEAGDYCTLDPVMAMTIESEESVTLYRGGTHMEGTAIILRQVEDYIVRENVA